MRVVLAALVLLASPSLSRAQPSGGDPDRAPANDSAGAPAAPAPSAAPTPPAPTPTAPTAPSAMPPEVAALVEQMVAAATPEARLAVANRLWSELGAVEPIAAGLRRSRSSSAAERRALLRGLGAAVPDDAGKFETPKRQDAAQLKADDALDWLAALASADSTAPGWRDALIDVALMRALASSGRMTAAAPLFDVGFGPDTMVYRDEVGRLLRAMAPMSIPELQLRGQGSGDAKRYANYQLERIDRQEPSKALAAAVRDEQLAVAILAVFEKTKHREAVKAVFATINASSPRVRAAARSAWMAYITGPAPKPGPKKFLELPGGKKSNKEVPLYLSYREIADNEVRKALEDLFGDEIADDAKIDLVAATERIFAHYDSEWKARVAALRQDAQAKRQAGNVDAACELYDRILVTGEDLGDRADIADAYRACGRAAADAEKWTQAAAAYGKAASLAATPDADRPTTALMHLMLAKAATAAGHDGKPQLDLALTLDPSLLPKAPDVMAKSTTPPWFLYGGVGAAGLALVSLAMGLARRRAR